LPAASDPAVRAGLVPRPLRKGSELMQLPLRTRPATGRARLGLGAVALAAVLVPVGLARIDAASAALPTRGGASDSPERGSAAGLGPLSGLLPPSKFSEESALQVDLSRQSVRLPLYPGDVEGKRALDKAAFNGGDDFLG